MTYHDPTESAFVLDESTCWQAGTMIMPQKNHYSQRLFTSKITFRQMLVVLPAKSGPTTVVKPTHGHAIPPVRRRYLVPFIAPYRSMKIRGLGELIPQI